MTWTIRYPWIISGGYTLGGLLVGAGFGGAIPSLIAGLAVWAVTGFLSLWRHRMLGWYGTAYIVKEDARDWDHDEQETFLAQVRRYFAGFVVVPGPRRVGKSWDWPLDTGAEQWDEKVSELVRAFRALHIGRDTAGIFIWAWWSVALAFGSRITRGDRGLRVRVWQRPGNARAGEITVDLSSARSHTFTGSPVSSGLVVEEDSWDHDADVEGPGASRQACVLLVRFGTQRWGPPDPAAWKLRDWAGVVPAGTLRIHELRCVPQAGVFGWDDFPFLAQQAAAWIQRKNRELPETTLLMGAIMPNEVALGVGLIAGRESTIGWPEHLWPIQYQPATKSFHIPRLDLGTAGFEGA
jgi:hypothetical protein